ncbi:hypothetical protein ABT352_33015 [Streptosporangium sp. NPDC000563]|uniref:hypothetical protein n=1 Tax=Streptosporangium sp. NPDC000563 TaxID=3154366 RepID=UPI003320AC1E
MSMRTQVRANLIERLKATLAGQVCDAFGGPAAECRHCWKARDNRPFGRDATPGDLYGSGPDIQEWMLRCRRCGLDCTVEGHPNGCPRTPGDSVELATAAMRPCYCGQAIVLAPDWLGTCCRDTPPVRMPEPCLLCDDHHCRVCDPNDQPENFFTSEKFGWAHARCVDQRQPEYAEVRRAKRHTPLGATR